MLLVFWMFNPPKNVLAPSICNMLHGPCVVEKKFLCEQSDIIKTHWQGRWNAFKNGGAKIWQFSKGVGKAATGCLSVFPVVWHHMEGVQDEWILLGTGGGCLWWATTGETNASGAEEILTFFGHQSRWYGWTQGGGRGTPIKAWQGVQSIWGSYCCDIDARRIMRPIKLVILVCPVSSNSLK